MNTTSKLVIAAGLAFMATTPLAAYAADDCIRLSSIDDSPAIDEKTILIKLKSSHQFKRIDLVSTCAGLTFSGFSHKTPEDMLCKSNPLHVNQIGGMTCMIDKIVDISEAEAKTLEAKRK